MLASEALVTIQPGLIKAVKTFELSVTCFGFWILSAEFDPSWTDGALDTDIGVFAGMVTVNRLWLGVASPGGVRFDWVLGISSDLCAGFPAVPVLGAIFVTDEIGFATNVDALDTSTFISVDPALTKTGCVDWLVDFARLASTIASTTTTGTPRFSAAEFMSVAALTPAWAAVEALTMVGLPCCRFDKFSLLISTRDLDLGLTVWIVPGMFSLEEIGTTFLIGWCWGSVCFWAIVFISS